MKKSILAAALLAATTAFAAAPSAPDLTTPAGFQRSCAEMPVSAPRPAAARQAPQGGQENSGAALRFLESADSLPNDDARLAWVICRDVDQVRDLITWGTQGMAMLDKAHPSKEQVVAEVTRKVDELREQLRRSRLQLQRVQLGKRTSLLIAPGQWQLDLNGNGQQEAWETWFFALPRPHDGASQPRLPDNDEDRYRREFDANALIRLDQSDVLWALSYHQFLEGLLTTVRAFDFDTDHGELVLSRPALLRSAHGLIAAGLATSEQLRRSVLAETDDEHEWVANPRQKSSVFPIPITAADFETWRALLQELDAVWQGRHLLPTTRGGRGLLASTAPVCPAGQGLDVARLFKSPPPVGTRVGFDRMPALNNQSCRTVDATHPLSNLSTRLDRTASEAGGMAALRYLYWVN
ncbi:hypothetical protein LRH25_06455 [Ideonella azotifigens]|uniref:Uncharacterized protein n=1 Tax=Ideonella azotifigens TaxID=513160 RepID=A0ABP3UZN1_9BURK|nr:hypothetical protein [Ideonella azotifigens]MCD2339980.1 hypothetical protein [Ideonella azotifigens]